ESVSGKSGDRLVSGRTPKHGRMDFYGAALEKNVRSRNRLRRPRRQRQPRRRLTRPPQARTSRTRPRRVLGARKISMKRVPLLAAVCLFLTRNTAPAPIYGPFPGLEEVIKGADFVVVAVINKRPDMTDMGAGGIYEIEIVKVLKGDTKEGKRSAYLRD